MGVELEEGDVMKNAGKITSFSLFQSGYSRQMELLNESGYDDVFLEDFLDTFDLLMDPYEGGVALLDSMYGEVEDLLDDTRFDSLQRMNTNFFSFVNGMEQLKDAEFRMAVFDQYRTGKETLHEVIQETYPNYPVSLEPEGVDGGEFEDFSVVFDSCMQSYGPLDTTDMFVFMDSVDTRIYRALSSIYNAGQAKSAVIPLVSHWITNSREVLPLKKSATAVTTPPEVAEVIIYDLMSRYLEGNIFRRCIRKSWTMNHGFILLPTVTTRFESSTSATSALLSGTVLEDGGSDVSSRGFVWAEHHNPTRDNHMATVGSGPGSFTLEVDGLIEGKTYYARSFAINEAGVAYGNCVPFEVSASGPTGQVEEAEEPMQLYPNPASNFLYLKIPGPLPGSDELRVLQLNGQVVLQQELEALPGEMSTIRLNLSGIPSGGYLMQVWDGSELTASMKFLIVR
jgi:hypothetical protein